MKNSFKLYTVCWTVLLALFNIICFISQEKIMESSKFGASFWVGYIFITAAFIGQLICSYTVFKTGFSKKTFYNLPIIKTGYIGLVLSVVFGTLTMAIPAIPSWAGAIICLIILCFEVIAVIKVKTASEIVNTIDEKSKAKTQLIKVLTAETAELVSRAKSETAQQACQKVYDAVRYSDPVSSEKLVEIENKLESKIAELSNSLSSSDEEKTKIIAEEAIVILKERNAKCKLNK